MEEEEHETVESEEIETEEEAPPTTEETAGLEATLAEDLVRLLGSMLKTKNVCVCSPLSGSHNDFGCLGVHVGVCFNVNKYTQHSNHVENVREGEQLR